jgi:DNA-binding NarL/FixJ family response regulator
MNNDSLSASSPQRDGDDTLRYAASLLARNDNELAVVLHRPNMWDVTVGTLIDAALTQTKGGKRRLRSVPASSQIARNFGAVLSSREIQVVRLIAEGLSNKQIGANLGLSDKTIKNHISHILAKLGLKARTQVAVLALRGGLC